MNGIFISGATTAACILAVLLLAGCASLNEGECRQADWVEIGYQDGTRGYPDQLSHHSKACSKHGIIADVDSYRRGHLRGLTAYCVPKTGYQLGVKPAEYKGQCPQAQEAEFVAEYVYGLRVAMESLAIEQDAIDSDLNRATMAKYSGAYEDEDTDYIDDRIDDLRDRLDRLLDQRRKINGWIRQWGG